MPKNKQTNFRCFPDVIICNTFLTFVITAMMMYNSNNNSFDIQMILKKDHDEPKIEQKCFFFSPLVLIFFSGLQASHFLENTNNNVDEISFFLIVLIKCVHQKLVQYIVHVRFQIAENDVHSSQQQFWNSSIGGSSDERVVDIYFLRQHFKKKMPRRR